MLVHSSCNSSLFRMGIRSVEEKTEVLYDPIEIVRRVVDRCYAIKYTMDCCVDTNGFVDICYS